MKNKKNFNNLFDSILTVLLFIGSISFYLLLIYVGVLHPKEGTNPVVVLIGLTSTIGLISITLLVIIFIWCFEYWSFNDKIIYSKKLLQKRKIIYLDQIEKVEKKKVSALVYGSYSSEAYIIYSGKVKITILINERKKYKYLDEELKKYISN